MSWPETHSTDTGCSLRYVQSSLYPGPMGFVTGLEGQGRLGPKLTSPNLGIELQMLSLALPRSLNSRARLHRTLSQTQLQCLKRHSLPFTPQAFPFGNNTARSLISLFECGWGPSPSMPHHPLHSTTTATGNSQSLVQLVQVTGTTTHFLISDTISVDSKVTVLIHTVAGEMGLALCTSGSVVYPAPPPFVFLCSVPF